MPTSTSAIGVEAAIIGGNIPPVKRFLVYLLLLAAVVCYFVGFGEGIVAPIVPT